MSWTTALVVPAASLKNSPLRSSSRTFAASSGVTGRPGRARPPPTWSARIKHIRAPRFSRWLAGHEELVQRVAEPLAIGAAHLPGHLVEQIGRGSRSRRLPDPEHRERGGKIQGAELVDQPLSLDPVDRGVPEAVEPLHRRREMTGARRHASNDLCPYWVEPGGRSSIASTRSG